MRVSSLSATPTDQALVYLYLTMNRSGSCVMQGVGRQQCMWPLLPFQGCKWNSTNSVV